MSEEHVWPEWVRAVLPPHRNDPIAPMVWATDGEIERVRPKMPLATLVVKRVCEPCNTGWMNAIEDAAIPVLSDLIAGHPRTLSPAAVKAAATWAFLKCLVVHLATHGGHPRVPPEAYQWAREHRHPPSGVLIVAACYGGNRHTLYASSGVVDFGIELNGHRTPWKGYVLSIGVGHLVFKVVGHHFPIAIDLKPAGENINRSCLVWPQPNNSVRWPPRVPLTNDTLFEFAREL